MFSSSDYELASRLTGLPVPRTPAEQAAAAPLVSQILRSYYRMPAPQPGFEGEGVNTSATRSLNSYPMVSQPEAKVQLERRLQAGVTNDISEEETAELLQIVMEDPELIAAFLQFIKNENQMAEDGAEYLSRQRPAEYDLPNYGGQYSLLNAPSNSSLPPSVEYQELG